MNAQQIPIEELEKLMLEKAFFELSELEKEFVLSQLASPADYEELRNTLFQIREVFSEDKSNLKMLPSRKEILISRFRSLHAPTTNTPAITVYQRKWIWAAAASLFLIVSLILVNHRYDALRKNQEIALRNEQSDLPAFEEQQGLSHEELNESAGAPVQKEATQIEQEIEITDANGEASATSNSDYVEKPAADKPERGFIASDERQADNTAMVAESKNAAPAMSATEDVMNFEYGESESVQTATKEESKKNKSVMGIIQATSASGASDAIDEYRKATIRKSFLFTDI